MGDTAGGAQPPAPSLRARVGLTTRGWTFLAAGVALGLVGALTGIVPAAQFGTLVALVPVSAAVLTRGPTRRPELHRTLSARELPSGDELRVTVSVRGRFPRGGSLLLEDVTPAALGGLHRFALTGVSGPAIRRPHYRVRVGQLGLHTVGPLRLHVVDRFGMVHRTLSADLRDHVFVVPRVVALDALVLGGASLGTGAGHLGALGAATDDVIPRDYRPGDEVRRMDWKASARAGMLMVRSEENPWRSSVTIVVDMRESAHRGRPPSSSLDAALGVVASVGCLALENGWDLTVRTTDDAAIFSGSPMTGVEQERRELLRALATAPMSHTRQPGPTLRHTADVASTGPVLLVLGSAAGTSARALTGVGAHSGQRLLVAVDADQWQPSEDPARQEAERAALLGEFTAAGWRVASLGPRGDLRSTWSGLAG